MNVEEPPRSTRQPRTIGFFVAVALAIVVLLVIAEIAGIGMRAWLGWWKELP
jgi:hypothetical protein